jgi:hypothetical protein
MHVSVGLNLPVVAGKQLGKDTPWQQRIVAGVVF